MKTLDLINDQIEISRSSNIIVFSFGRFNPPHIGHQLLVESINAIAMRTNADRLLFVSPSEKTVTNPLDFNFKLKLLEQIFPNIPIIGRTYIRTLFDVLLQLEILGWEKLLMVVGSDRKKEFQALLDKYINHEDLERRLKFETYQIISIGDRDESDDLSGISSTKMRRFIFDDDLASFKRYFPDPRYAKLTFDKVKKGLGLV